jgi:hypothetical protein
LIRGLANRLGDDAKNRYECTGKPTLIKCTLETDWIDKDATFPVSESYVKDVLWALIRLRRWPDEETAEFQGGFLLTRRVPPENIVDFIDMSHIFAE